MKVRYQADADLDGRIVRAVRRHEPGIDFQFASEARSGGGLKGLVDDHVLTVAAREGRILVTHDRRTMPKHSEDAEQQSLGAAYRRSALRRAKVLAILAQRGHRIPQRPKRKLRLMAGTDIPDALRDFVRERATGRCEYCLTSTGQLEFLAEAQQSPRFQANHIKLVAHV